MHRKVLVVALSIAAIALAQDAPRFEVASIKPSGPRSVRDSEGGPGTSAPTRYHFNSATLLDLIVVAYHVDYFQVSSKTPLDRDRFDLIANVPEGSTKAQFRLMMQSLLAERFHLQTHIQSKDFPAYELVVAKTGPKFRESVPSPSAAPANPRRFSDDGFPELPPNRPGFVSRHTLSGGMILVRTRAQQETMSVLADGLRPADGRPIVDKTGLTGKYDFQLEYAMEIPGAAPGAEPPAPPAPTLFTALQQQLGLQLVDKKLPFDVVIVDSVDRLPTEN